MQRRQHKVARERRFQSEMRGFFVTYLAHHDDVGVVSQNAPQGKREGHSELGVDRDLVDSGHLVFHRVFDGDDMLVDAVDRLQGAVERCRFAAARRSG